MILFAKFDFKAAEFESQPTHTPCQTYLNFSPKHLFCIHSSSSKLIPNQTNPDAPGWRSTQPTSPKGQYLTSRVTQSVSICFWAGNETKKSTFLQIRPFTPKLL